VNAPEDARSGGVTATPPPDPGPHAALAAITNATGAIERANAYTNLLNQLTDDRAAVYDTVCGRITPVGAWYTRCMRRPDRRATHTAQTQRWAREDDHVLRRRWPLIDACWPEEAS
jgi:hypothetical protein